jgi:hypothetical protein
VFPVTAGSPARESRAALYPNNAGYFSNGRSATRKAGKLQPLRNEIALILIHLVIYTYKILIVNLHCFKRFDLKLVKGEEIN